MKYISSTTKLFRFRVLPVASKCKPWIIVIKVLQPECTKLSWWIIYKLYIKNFDSKFHTLTPNMVHLVCTGLQKWLFFYKLIKSYSCWFEFVNTNIWCSKTWFSRWHSNKLIRKRENESSIFLQCIYSPKHYRTAGNALKTMKILSTKNCSFQKWIEILNSQSLMKICTSFFAVKMKLHS